MPEPTIEKKFMEALTQYVDFRLHEKGEPVDADKLPGHLTRFVGMFELFLESRGGSSGARAFKLLLKKMGDMKNTRGGVNPPPAAGMPPEPEP